MQASRRVIAGVALMLLALGGCSSSDDEAPELMHVRSTGAGPDEFAILPAKPLEMPTSMAELPTPTPGGSNRTDATPEADAIVALGGRPDAGGGIPAVDSAVIAQTTRFGVTPGVRQTLAAEDLEFRRDNNGRVLERVFNVNIYFRAYAEQSLDQQAELEYWRSRGARNVSAPPPPADD